MYKDKDFYIATAVLIGTIIGAGIFGIPYAAAQSSFFWVVLCLVVLGFFVYVIQATYAVVFLKTPGHHRLIGFVEKYLGKRVKIFAVLILVFGYYGSLLAYIIIGGKFLHSFLGGLFGGTPFIYSIALSLSAACIIYLGLKLISKGELIMTLLLFFTVGVIIFKGFSYVEMENFTVLNFKNFFLPYGIILFSLIGWSAIPEMGTLLRKKSQYLKPAIWWGTFIPVLIYIIFTFIILGVTGSETSTESLSGFVKFFGNGVAVISAIFGFLSVTTSFLVIGLNLKENFWYDCHLSHGVAWALTCMVPILFFIFVSQDFIKIISLVGGIIGGLVGIIIVLLYWEVEKTSNKKIEMDFKLSKTLGFIIIGVFILGIIYEIIYSLF